MCRKKDRFPQNRKQEPADCGRGFLQMKKNGRRCSAPAEQARKEKHGGQRPSVSGPRRRSLGVSGSPIGSANLCSYVNKKQNRERDRNSDSRCFAAGYRGRIFFLMRLPKWHSQKHDGEQSTSRSDNVQEQADMRSAKREHR